MTPNKPSGQQANFYMNLRTSYKARYFNWPKTAPSPSIFLFDQTNGQYFGSDLQTYTTPAHAPAVNFGFM